MKKRKKNKRFADQLTTIEKVIEIFWNEFSLTPALCKIEKRTLVKKKKCGILDLFSFVLLFFQMNEVFFFRLICTSML